MIPKDLNTLSEDQIAARLAGEPPANMRPAHALTGDTLPAGGARFSDLASGDLAGGAEERGAASHTAQPGGASPAALPPTLEFPTLRSLVSGPPRPAAVLAPLLRIDNAWHILFTRRNAALPEHSGQVSFPGGSADPGDLSPEATALREAKEEIGLDPAAVRILGRLRPYHTITNYLITPVIGAIPWPVTLVPAEIEVSRIFTIPITWLADPAHRAERLRQLPPPHAPVGVLYYNEFDGEVLWGATARMTLQLIQILTASS